MRFNVTNRSITNQVLSSHTNVEKNKTLEMKICQKLTRMKSFDSVVMHKRLRDTTRNFELGIENDLTKVMINQQISSLGFQLTLNTRNKVLSAYKDIMSMPV